MPSPKSIAEQKQLIVEGSDAERFFGALLKEMGLGGIQVQNFGGKDELPGFLKAFRNVPDFSDVTSVGIVRDAETDPTSAFQSACSALNNAGLPVPRQPLIQEGTDPQIALLILPDATSPGMLETICLEAVVSDPVILCVDEYFDCVKKQTGSLPANMEKARLHAFLASRTKPNLRLGEAADAGYWPWGTPVFDPIKHFLRSL